MFIVAVPFSPPLSLSLASRRNSTDHSRQPSLVAPSERTKNDDSLPTDTILLVV